MPSWLKEIICVFWVLFLVIIMPFCRCGDQRLIFKGFYDGERPLARATCWSYCTRCWKRSALCRSCAERCATTTGCFTCGQLEPKISFTFEPAKLHPPKEDCVANTDDVRTLCPRFTPAARSHLRLPGCWEQCSSKSGKLLNWWRFIEEDQCSGCDVQTRFRSLWNVVLRMDTTTAGYTHKLCGLCAFCIQNRYVDMLTASKGRQVFCENEPAVVHVEITQYFLQQSDTQPRQRLIFPTLG